MHGAVGVAKEVLALGEDPVDTAQETGANEEEDAVEERDGADAVKGEAAEAEPPFAADSRL